MGRNLIETIMGAVVLLVAGFFLAFAYTHADLEEVSGYEVTAQFSGVGGLETGSDVRINGIKVGTVSGQALDPVSFNAEVRMTITPSVQLPQDSEAVIATEGLLGGKYVRILPGHDEARIPAGGMITQTKDYKSIEETVSQLIFLATSDQQAQPAAPAPAPEPEAVPSEPMPGAAPTGAGQ